MTVLTLHRAETEHQPAARCTFEQRILENGRKLVQVEMQFFYPSTGWISGMGKGEGFYNVKHAKEFYALLQSVGYVAA